MRENAQAVRNLEMCEPCLLLLFLVSYVPLALAIPLRERPNLAIIASSSKVPARNSCKKHSCDPLAAMEVPMRRVRVRFRLGGSLVRERKGTRGAIHIALTAARAETFFPTPEIAPYDRQQDKETDYYYAKTEIQELMDGTSVPDEVQKRILSFLRSDVEGRGGDLSGSSLLLSVETHEPPPAIVWTTPKLYALEAATRQLHGCELPSVDVFDSMGNVEARGLQQLMSCRQSHGHSPLAATALRNASKSQKAFEEFKTLLFRVMKRRTKGNRINGFGRKKGETMEQWWWRLLEIPRSIDDTKLQQLRRAIEKIRVCSSVSAEAEGPKWARVNSDWFVDNDCPYAPPREEPDADELAWVGRRYRDEEGVWCIKKVEFSKRDKELAVWAYPADEEPPEDDEELDRELLGPFKEALDDGDNVWVESE